MASFTGTKIKDTYKSILKVSDNGELEATAQEITDGNGNGTGVSLNTSGDVTATGTVAFGSLKDSGENITITKFVDEADGIGSNDNDTSIPTSAAVKDYVDNNITAQDLDITDGTNIGSVDLDSQSLTFTGDAGVSATVSGQTLTLDSSALQSQITSNDSDITALQAADVTLQNNIDAEASTRSSADTTLQSNIDTEAATRAAADSSEQTARLAADATLQSNIDAEETARIAADNTLQSNITSEASTRAAADTTLQSNIDSEASTRAIADTALQTQITSNDSDISGLDTRLTTAEGNITSNDSDISALDGRLTTAEGNISSNDTDISNLQSGKYDKAGGAISGNVTIGGDLTVNGTTTTINTQTLSVEDPLIELANQNAANTIDTGFYADYSLDAGVTTKYAGLFKDASDSDKFKLFKGLEVEPTTTVNTAGTGYAKGDLVIGNLEADNVTGTVTATSVLADGVTATTQSAGDNSTKVATTAYVDAAVTAEDLDFAGDSGTGAVDLDSQTFTIAGTANEIETSASGQTITIGLPSSVTVGTLSATTLGGTLSTAAQPNITSVGTLSSLAVSGDLTVDTGQISLFASDGLTQIGKLYDDSGFVVEGKVNNNLILRTKANSSGEGIKFQDSSSNDLMFVDGLNGRVGINTNSPSQRLHIKEDDATAVYTRVSNSAGVFEAGVDASGNGEIGMTTADALLFNTSGSERMRITSTGNVGIGNIGSNAKLEVSASSGEVFRADASGGAYRIVANQSGVNLNGNVGIGTSSPAAVLEVNNDTDGETVAIFEGRYGALSDVTLASFQRNGGAVSAAVKYADASTAIEFGTTTGHPLILTTGDTERMRIDSAGRVGIGTSSPDLPLTVNGLIKSYGADSQIRLGQLSATATFIQSVSADSTTSRDLVFYGTAEYMRIDSSGNVGIGVSPSAKLEVKGGTSGFRLITSNATSATFSMLTDLGLGYDNAAQLIAGQSSSNNAHLIFATKTSGSVTEKMRIDSSGRVIIESSGELELGGEGISAGYVISEEALYFNTDINNNGDGLIVFGQGRSRATGGTEYMRIDSSGNVGIGTTNGDIFGRFYTRSVGIDSAGITKIQIDGASYTGIDFGINGTRNGEINNTSTGFYINTIDARPLIFTTNGSERMRITSGGAVAVNTTGVSSATNPKFAVQQFAAASVMDIYGNGNSQGAAQNIKIVRHYPVVSLGTKLIIPFISQGNLNSTTIMKIWGHGARYNNAAVNGFTATIEVGHLTSIQNANLLESSGNVASISTSGSNVEINFTGNYTSGTADGVFVTIEYMTSLLGYSIDIPNIAMN